MMADVNIWAIGLAAILSNGLTFFFARYGKAFDARGQAEAALIGIGPAIIREQNDRIKEQYDLIKQLQSEIDKLWRLEHDCQDKLARAERRLVEVERRMNDD